MKLSNMLLMLSIVVLFTALFFVNIAYQNKLVEKKKNVDDMKSDDAEMTKTSTLPSIDVSHIPMRHYEPERSEYANEFGELTELENTDEVESEEAETDNWTYERYQDEITPRCSGPYPETGINSSLGLGGNLGGETSNPDYNP